MTSKKDTALDTSMEPISAKKTPDDKEVEKPPKESSEQILDPSLPIIHSFPNDAPGEEHRYSIDCLCKPKVSKTKDGVAVKHN